MTKGSTFFIILIIILLTANYCTKQSAEKELIRILADCQQAANLKDEKKILDYISLEYIDFEGNDRNKLSSILQNYFQNYPLLKTKILGKRIKVSSNQQQASAIFDVHLNASAGGFSLPIFSAEQSWLQIKLEFNKTGRFWKIIYAQWQTAGLSELLSESIPLLPKTFQKQ